MAVKPLAALALVSLSSFAGHPETAALSGQALPVGGAPAPLAVGPLRITPEQAAAADIVYPFYMPMQGLRRPANRLFVKCDASRAAGHEVYAGRSADDLGGRAEGGFEFVYEALDKAGQPCVYPFAPWQPQIVGALDGTQYIFRSSIPGRRVTFRTQDQWASIDLRLFDFGRQRVHFELRDIALEFPGAIQPMGAVHLEAFGGARPGLFTAVIRRSRIYGGKNALSSM